MFTNFKTILGERFAAANRTRFILGLCLLGLGTASAAVQTFHVSGTLADSATFSGTVSINTTGNITTAVTGASITISAPDSVTCGSAINYQGNAGSAGYYFDLACTSGHFMLTFLTPLSSGGYLNGYMGGGVDTTATNASYYKGTGEQINVTAGTVTNLTPPTLSKAFGSAFAFTGSSVSMTFTVTNGNSAPLTGLVFSDTFPTGLTLAGVGHVSSACDPILFAFDVADGTSFTTTISSLAANSTCSFVVDVTPSVAGTLVNTTSTLTSNEASPAPAATASIVVYPASDGAFQVSYAADPSAGESYINIVNTGANGDALLGPGYGAQSGNICVNVYAFDPAEELISCCSCLITPNSVVNLGVNRDLTSMTLTGVVPTSVVVKLVATLAGTGGSGTSCSQSAASEGYLVAGMVAYGSTPQPVGTVFNSVEHTFVPSTLSAGEWDSITGRCASILGNGSNFGVCNSCKAGALGAAKQ